MLLGGESLAVLPLAALPLPSGLQQPVRHAIMPVDIRSAVMPIDT